MINAGSIIASLDLDTGKFSTKLAAAQASTDGFVDKLKGYSGAFEDLGKGLTLGITTPIVGVGVAATNTALNFEAGMSRVQAIAGATEGQLGQLSAQALQLGADTSFSASEVAAGMENLASAGYETNEIMAAMPGLLDLAAVSGGDVALASDVAASAINGFGLAAGEASHVADVFARAAADTNAEVADMGEAMKYIAPVANAMGLSIEETAAAVGILSDAGIKGSQAGTTLRGTLTRLTKPTETMSEVMDELGISFFDAQGNMLPLSGIIEQLQIGTAGLTQEQKNAAMATLFGQEALSGMLVLTDAGPETLDALTTSLENSSGAAKEMADIILDNGKGAIEEMSGALETASIKVGTILIPTITDAANWIGEMADKFNALDEETQKNIVQIAGYAVAAGPVILLTSKLAQGIGSVAGGYQLLTKAIIPATAAKAVDKAETTYLLGLYAKDAIAKGASTVATKGMTLAQTAYNGVASAGALASKGLGAAIGFLTSPMGLTVLAIGGVVAAGVALYKNWDTVKEKAFEVGDKISGLATDAVDWGKNLIEGFWNGITNASEWLKGKVTGFVDNIKNVFTGKDGFDMHSPAKVPEMWGQWINEGLAGGIEKHASKPISQAENMANAIGSTLQKVESYVTSAVSIIEKEFDLWVLKNNAVAGSSEYLENQMEMQRQKHEYLNQQIDATNTALQNAITTYGEGSTEAMKYKEALLTLQIEQENLAKSIANANSQLKEQASLYAGATNFDSQSAQEIFKKTRKRIREKNDSEEEDNSAEIADIARRNNVDLSTAKSMFDSNERDKIFNRVPKYAIGTNYHQGGFAIVGDEGPELIELPRASKVYSNQETKEMLGKGKGDIYQNINIYSTVPSISEASRKFKQAAQQLAMEWGV